MKNTVKKRTATLFSALTLLLLTLTPAHAAGIADSTLGAGITKLVNDVFLYLTVICPVAGGLAAVWFLIRRSMADEQDGKLWEKRIRTAIICGVAGCLVSGIITLISSYF